MKTFEVNNEPLELGSIMRCGGGARIAQVVALRGDDVLMVLAGRIHAGEHTPPQRVMAVKGIGIPGRNMVLVEARTTTEVYTHVTPLVELHNLLW